MGGGGEGGVPLLCLQCMYHLSISKGRQNCQFSISKGHKK